MKPLHPPHHTAILLAFAGSALSCFTSHAQDARFQGTGTATIYGSPIISGDDFTTQNTLPLMQEGDTELMLADDRTSAHAGLTYQAGDGMWDFQLVGESGDLGPTPGLAYTEVHAEGEFVVSTMTKIAISLTNFGYHNVDFCLRLDETALLHASYDMDAGTGELETDGFDVDPGGNAAPLMQTLTLEPGTYNLDLAIYNNVDGRGPYATSDKAALSVKVIGENDIVAPPPAHMPTPTALGAGVVLLLAQGGRRRRAA